MTDLKENSIGQTVYEQLQEIVDKIADKTLRFGCKLLRHSHDGFHKEYYILGPGSHSKRWISSQPFGSMDLEFNEDMISKSSGDWYKVIGHPISLSKVLSALGDDKNNGHIETHQYADGSLQIFTDNSNNRLCIWKLTNEDNSDAMLDDQSDETIKAIREIVCKSEK